MPILPSTLTDAAAALRAGTTTSRALTEASIARADANDAEIGSYLARYDDPEGLLAEIMGRVKKSLDDALPFTMSPTWRVLRSSATILLTSRSVDSMPLALK